MKRGGGGLEGPSDEETSISVERFGSTAFFVSEAFLRVCKRKCVGDGYSIESGERCSAHLFEVNGKEHERSERDE